MRPIVFLSLLFAFAVPVFCAEAVDTPVSAAPAAVPAPAAATTPAAPAAAPAAHAPLSPTATTPAEIELGKKVSEQMEKQFKLVKDDPKSVERCNTIANYLAPYTQRPDVVYTCKILDTGILNAMSIPGGTIYVTKGLLKAVESDDELAGVLAHEIAHNSLYHVKRMAQKEGKANLEQIALILASIYMNRHDEVTSGQFYYMSELVKEALLNGYTMDCEREADRNGMIYLSKQKRYDPAGLYSVMLGFKKDEDAHPKVNWGYLQTHPYSDERKTNLEQAMKELGITPNLWHVINFHAEVVPVDEGKKGYKVTLGGVDIITLTAADGTQDAKARATAAANAINRRFAKSYLQQFEVVMDCDDNTAVISMPTIPVLTLTKDDAKAAGVSVEYLGTLAKANIQNAIMRAKMARGW